MFISCIISFFLDILSVRFTNSLNSKSPYLYGTLDYPPRNYNKKKERKKERKKGAQELSKLHCLLERTDFAAMFARYYFRGREYGETQLLQFSTRLQSAHKLRVTTKGSFDAFPIVQECTD